MATTKLTVIVDNNACGGLQGEWGLCIFVEHNGRNILVDTGASSLFVTNLNALGFDIAKVDFATLSHAHFDHANGMATFFAKNSQAKFYIRETTAENCYAKYFIFHKYIGIPSRILLDYQDRFEVVSGDYELMPGAYLIPHKTAGLERLGKREKMYQKTALGWQPDNFSHEQSLVLETEKGLVIINSCSHGGAVNIINEVAETFPGKHIHALIGGFHLYNKSDEEVRQVAQAIRDTGVELVCTGHCTKERAFEIMHDELGDMVQMFHVGLQLEF